MPKDQLFYGTEELQDLQRAILLTVTGTTSSSLASLLGSPRERHGPLRRLVSHGFSEKALREQEPLIQSYCDLLMKQLHHHCDNGNKMVDLVKWYNVRDPEALG
jgi:cytochrome P450